MALTEKQRILKVMNHCYRRGINKESVNTVYRNIIKEKFNQN